MRIPLLIIAVTGLCGAQAQPTLGLMQYDPSSTEGYVLFAPISNTHTYLIDKCGREVHQWNSTYTAGLGAQLQTDGSLLRAVNTLDPLYGAGGSGGGLERHDWNGNLLWSLDLSNDSLCQHHDFTVLPNGHILVIAWERHDSADAVLHGKDPLTTNAELWSERILELQPVGNDSAIVVWQWRLWDHLVQDHDNGLPGYGVVSDHPELVDINFFQGPPNSFDWIHMNSITYNSGRDEILVSAHNMDEIWVIDHSTTTAEAAGHTGGGSGHGGDLLFRWGNARAYGRGTVADQRLFGQHHATWWSAGQIMIFNNGVGRPGPDYSSVDMIEPPTNGPGGEYLINAGTAFLPATAQWSYTAATPTDFFAHNISGAQQLPTGFMITDGPAGRFFEIGQNENTIWEYINPVDASGPMTQGETPGNNSVFRCEFYAPDFAGFTGLTLTPGDEIELDPIVPSLCVLAGTNEVSAARIEVHPNPVVDQLILSWSQGAPASLLVTDLEGRAIPVSWSFSGEHLEMDCSRLAGGAYVLLLRDATGKIVGRTRFVKVEGS